MICKSTGIVFALCVLVAPAARAQDDKIVKSCEAAFIDACVQDCATARCIAKCEKQAHDACRVNLTAQQDTFSGPVISTPVDCLQTDASTPATCFAVRGTVANRNYFGGGVTAYAICPVEGPFAQTFVIATTCSSATDGGFSVVAPNTYSGQNSCYGLLAVTGPGTNSCGVNNLSSPNTDPNWSTCTAGPCPSK